MSGRYYMEELYSFLDELAANNNRNWLVANRSRYDDLRGQWLDDLGRLIGLIKEWEPACGPDDPRRAAYRFARDTRFSPDKTPYKTYFRQLSARAVAGRLMPDIISISVMREMEVSRGFTGACIVRPSRC